MSRDYFKISKKTSEKLRRLRIGKHWDKSVKLKMSKSNKQHNNFVLKLKKHYNSLGYKTMSFLDLQPDLIIRKGGKLYAIEVERQTHSIRHKLERYKKVNVFDEIKFIRLLRRNIILKEGEVNK